MVAQLKVPVGVEIENQSGVVVFQYNNEYTFGTAVALVFMDAVLKCLTENPAMSAFVFAMLEVCIEPEHTIGTAPITRATGPCIIRGRSVDTSNGLFRGLDALALVAAARSF